MLRFQEGSFKDPFIARYVSDGTIKMFAYLVALTRSLIRCWQSRSRKTSSPELLHELAEEFRDYARPLCPLTRTSCWVEVDELFYLVKQGGYSPCGAHESKLLRLVTEGDFGSLAARLFRRRPSSVSRVVFLLEEPSMRTLLEGLCDDYSCLGGRSGRNLVVRPWRRRWWWGRRRWDGSRDRPGLAKLDLPLTHPESQPAPSGAPLRHT